MGSDENLLKEYFSKLGEVLKVTVIRKPTSQSKGYGFVSFSDPIVIDRVLQDKHQIDDREVDLERRTSREEQKPAERSGNFNSSTSLDSGVNARAKKIFVGGLSPTLTSEEFEAYFETYGPVSDAVIMIDPPTQRPRGFGFVSFYSEDSVDRVLHKTFHCLNGNRVEVKRAIPKDANPGVASGGGDEAGAASGGGGAGAASSGGGLGSFPVYGCSGGNGYEGHKDSNRPGRSGNSNFNPNRIFVGGLAPSVTSEELRDYFKIYGPVSDAVIMIDQLTQRPKGYGFVSFYSEASMDSALRITCQDLNGKHVKVKPAIASGGGGVGGFPGYGGSSGSGYGGFVRYGYPAGEPYRGPGILAAGPRSSAVNDSSNGTPSAYGAEDGSAGGYTDASNGSGGNGNHQANNRQAGYGGSCGKGKQVQQ